MVVCQYNRILQSGCKGSEIFWIVQERNGFFAFFLKQWRTQSIFLRGKNGVTRMSFGIMNIGEQGHSWGYLRALIHKVGRLLMGLL